MAMNTKKKIRIGLLFCSLAFFSLIARPSWAAASADNFRAEVRQVLETAEKTRADGSRYKQQNLELQALDGPWAGETIVYKGISELEVVDSNYYEAGDRVYASGSLDENGQATFYVNELVRSSYLYWLFALFAALVIIIGRRKGWRSLIGLALSFVVIVKLLLPWILKGGDPFLASLLGGLLIMAIIIYLSEGWKRKSHLAILSVLLSLGVTLGLSLLFVALTRLSGLSQEEVMFLIGDGQGAINFRGLLLAGFVIGAVGVLDDIVVGQIEAAMQIREANPGLPPRQVFRLAYRVGNTHLGAIINTLFLTYAGASLPLLLLFSLNQGTGVDFSRLINTEAVSTEIVRTLVGSIGVILSMPIATACGAFGFSRKGRE
jgi:uncharacterized membrane protein